MSPNAWSLPTVCFSIVVKADAVDRSFPGGRDRFIALYRPQFRNGALFGLVAMSVDSVEHALGQLNDNGLLPGQDVAVGDMMHGPILSCPGVVFIRGGDEFMPRWCVNVDGLTGPRRHDSNRV